MVLPLHLLWKLQITKKQKFALVVIFSLGTIIIIVAIVRVIEVSPKFDHVDPLWLSLWSMIEASVGKLYLLYSLSVRPSFKAHLG